MKDYIIFLLGTGLGCFVGTLATNIIITEYKIKKQRKEDTTIGENWDKILSKGINMANGYQPISGKVKEGVKP